MKKWISAVLGAALLLSLLAGCGGGSGKPADGGKTGGTLKISLWLGKGEDSSFYYSYNDNPVIKYLETLEFNGQKVDIDCMSPISGAELDNFNTLLMTDAYADVLDMSYSVTYPAELYGDGYIWDLTPYVEQYMPNYMAVLEANPQLAPYVYSTVDGEKKILSIYSLTEKVSGTSFGLLYRRDWLAKYGTNPETGAAFTFGYTDEANYNTYYDDVVFPSGGSDPVYLSDWEWMFGIFQQAMAQLGITDGYCYSPYFKGYNESGMLCNAFGGGGPMWYMAQDGTSAFGGTNESLRTYLQCMNTWYENGWLDKSFSEHTADSVYTIDTAKVHMGKVGMWVGRRFESGGEMDMGDANTDGIMVFGARQPINDLYGDAALRNKEPFTLYQSSQLRGSVVVTNKVLEEELPTLLTFLDYLYTEDGGKLVYCGLTKEQFEVTQDETYIKYGLTEGTHWEEVQPDGTKKYGYYPAYSEAFSGVSAFSGVRLPIGYITEAVLTGAKNPAKVVSNKAQEEWDYYINTGYPAKAIQTQFTTDESNAFGKVHANVDTYMASTIPKFITGGLDIDSDQAWNDYCKMLNKYGPDKVTAIYQRIYDSMGN